MQPTDSAKTLFLREIARRGIPVLAELPDEAFVIAILGVECTVSLDNIRRKVVDGQGADAMSRFVDGLVATRVALPSWPEAASGIRYSAEAGDHDFAGTLSQPITRAMSRVLVFTDAAESRVAWLTPSHLDRWGVSVDDVDAHAASNMDRLLATTTLEIKRVAGAELGMFATGSIFKASLLFSPALTGFVSRLGWPLFVVAPCRDFLYAFTDEALIPRLSSVVTREFAASGYPITREVLEISDTGIRALGVYGD
jgi:hypothetical protein